MNVAGGMLPEAIPTVTIRLSRPSPGPILYQR